MHVTHFNCEEYNNLIESYYCTDEEIEQFINDPTVAAALPRYDAEHRRYRNGLGIEEFRLVNYRPYSSNAAVVRPNATSNSVTSG